MTDNEKRQATGLDDIDGGDVLYKPAAMLPVGDEPEEDEPDDDDKPDTEDEDDEDPGKMTPARAEAANLLAYGDGKARQFLTRKAV